MFLFFLIMDITCLITDNLTSCSTFNETWFHTANIMQTTLVGKYKHFTHFRCKLYDYIFIIRVNNAWVKQFQLNWMTLFILHILWYYLENFSLFIVISIIRTCDIFWHLRRKHFNRGSHNCDHFPSNYNTRINRYNLLQARNPILFMG